MDMLGVLLGVLLAQLPEGERTRLMCWWAAAIAIEAAILLAVAAVAAVVLW